MARRATRRDFIKTTSVIGAGYFAGHGFNLRESRSAIETIHFACIGVGGKGESDSADAGNNGNIVAICDIDEERLDKAASKFEGAKKFIDYRKMLDEMGKSIDAVTVSTPDHTHAPASVMAMKMGKHCFTQKPMTHTLYEARAMADLAREKNLATQMGNQGTAHNDLRKGAAVIKSGALGKLKEVHVWTNRPVWPQGEERPKESEPIPAHVHWAEFLGPAKSRPYNSIYHPFKWRGWWDFGTGALGDMACHTLNMPYMGAVLRDPTSVQAETSGHNKDTYPRWSIITFEFPALGERAAVNFKWYDGGKRPTSELFKTAEATAQKEVLSKVKDSDRAEKTKKFEEKMTSGAFIVGEKAWMLSPGDYAGDGLYFPDGMDAPKVEWVRSPGHFEEWVAAIKGGPEATSNFQYYAGGLTETVLLGNLAVWAAAEPGLGKKIEWNAKTLTATNAPEVAHIVKKEYLNGYSL